MDALSVWTAGPLPNCFYPLNGDFIMNEQPRFDDLKYFSRPIKFAADAHRGQKRKYTGEPYIAHPLAVAELVRKAGGDWEQITAALLHDTVEDTDVTLGDVYKEFGGDVAMAVYYLTDDERRDRNRFQHKIDLANRWLEAPEWIRMIKVADLIDNTRTIVAHDEGFSRVYMAEKAHLLRHLQPGHDGLIMTAAFIIHMYNPELLLASIYGAGLKKLTDIAKGTKP